MKHFLSTCILVTLAPLATMSRADDLATPHITVSGTAITEAAPDNLVWSLELKNTGPDLAKVAEKHSALSATVLKTIKDFGVADKDVQTSRMEFGENMVYRTRSYVKEGYLATTSVSFKLSELGKYKKSGPASPPSAASRSKARPTISRSASSCKNRRARKRCSPPKKKPA